MRTPQLTSFGLWTLTAFSLIGLFLEFAPASNQQLPPTAPRSSTAVNQEHVRFLLSTATTANAATAATTAPGQLPLLGIAYSSAPHQSRALIQTSARKLESFAEGSRLPNDARLVKINKRSITYEIAGQHHDVELPAQRL